MKKSLMIKIVKRVIEIINESIDDDKDIDKNPCQIKQYAMSKTGLELNLPLESIEYSVETYRKGDLKIGL